MNHQFRVVAGPYRIARKYAESMGWSEDDYIIVSRGHKLAALDPAMIASIVIVALHTMAARIMSDIVSEIDRVRAIWPVPVSAAA